MTSVTQAHPYAGKLHSAVDPTLLAPRHRTEGLARTQEPNLPLAHVPESSTPWSQDTSGRGTWNIRSDPVHSYRDTAMGTSLCLKDQQMAGPIHHDANISLKVFLSPLI